MRQGKPVDEEIKINGRWIGGNNPTYIIAEIGRTYNNDLKTAEMMIEAVAKAGGDAIKIQSIRAKDLLVNNLETKNHYQQLERLERSFEDHKYLAGIAEDYCLDFISTPESTSMVDLLEKVGVRAYKVASLDLVYYDLLKYIAVKQKPIFISTGMASLDEVRDALEVIRSLGNDKIVLLYCVSLYPPKPEEIDLNTIKTFKETFKVISGFSDHISGISGSLSAVALGAKVIEKHFTLDKTQPGDDHKVSVEPNELSTLVNEIRKIEKMLGSGDKILCDREKELAKFKRRKIVAAHDLEKGTKIKKKFLNFKQLDMAEGIQSQFENEVKGKVLKVNIKKDEPFFWDMIH